MKNPEWKSYEEVAAYLLNQFADEFQLSRVEGIQSVDGLRSKTSWEIDAKAFLANGEGFLIVECRRYTKSKQSQEKIGALAYRIIDAGAAGGILVSPHGLQSGAEKIAQAEKIMSITLDANSTPYEFGMRFLNKVFVGIHEQLTVSDFMTVELLRPCSICGKNFVVLNNETVCNAC